MRTTIALILAIATAAPVALDAAQRDARAEAQLQAAMNKETVEGDLKEAIEMYRRIAQSTNRAVAAKALYGLAQCYRKQGDAQAKTTLERVVREFGDQPVAAQARTQLAAFSATAKPGGIRLQKLFGGSNDGCSSVSADGKLLGCAVGYVDDAAVYEIETGRMRVLTALRKETPANRYINTFAISPDGKWMALHIYHAGGVLSEIAIVATDGRGTLRTVYKHAGGRWLDVHAWTPDNKEILFSVSAPKSGGPLPLMTVSAASGATKLLRELRAGIQWVFTAYSPDGKWLAMNVPGAEPRSYNVEIWNAAGELSATVAKAESNGNVAGWAPDGKSLVVSSSRDGRASLFQFPVANGKVMGQPQTIRAVTEDIGRSLGIDSKGVLYMTVGRAEADLYAAPFDPQSGNLAGAESLLSNRARHRQGFGSWSPDGKKFASWTFARYDNVNIAKAQLIVRTLPSGPETIALPEMPFHPYHVPTWDSESKSLFMLAAEGTPGLYRLVRLNPLSGKVTPASVPISIPNIGFTPSWTADGRFLFQRKGSNDIFRIDAQSGEEKLLYKHAEETGVRNPAISPDGARLAYFGASRVMKGGGEWTGTTHRWLHVMDLAGGIVRNIEIPIRGAWGASVIAWSPDSRFLVYATFDEKEPGIWIAPADGSASPRPLSKVLDGHVSHLAFSPDGKTLSFTLSTRQEDIWMMSNFLGSAQ